MSNATPTQKKDIHAAITELVIELMGEGTVQALADKLNMSRNRLVRYIQSYHAQMKGEEYTPMRWDLDTLVIIAQELKIQVSDVIKAAEDVQDGLPAWFHLRITEGTEPHSKDRLLNIFLEAVGCHAYGGKIDPLGVKGQRKSRYRLDGMIPMDVTYDFWRLLKSLMAKNEMKIFNDRYFENKLSDTEAYHELKNALYSIHRSSLNQKANISGEATKKWSQMIFDSNKAFETGENIIVIAKRGTKRKNSWDNWKLDLLTNEQEELVEYLVDGTESKPQVDKTPEN